MSLKFSIFHNRMINEIRLIRSNNNNNNKIINYSKEVMIKEES